MIVRNVIINSFCPHKIREELTARIKFCTNNHFYEKVFLLLSLLLKYIEICKNILRDDTTRKIKYLTLFFFFFYIWPIASKRITNTVYKHSSQSSNFRSLGTESRKLQFSWNFEKKKPSVFFYFTGEQHTKRKKRENVS